MICKSCGQRCNSELTSYYKGVKKVGCKACIHLVSLYSTKIIDHKTGTMSVAHRHDMEMRKIDGDGRVYRDKGRKFI